MCNLRANVGQSWLEGYAFRTPLAARAFALEHVCAISSIHVAAFRPETLHLICTLLVIVACNAAMTGAPLVVPVHIPYLRCSCATTNEAFHSL